MSVERCATKGQSPRPTLLQARILVTVENITRLTSCFFFLLITPDSEVHGANMGPSCVLSAPDGPHVGPMNLAIRDILSCGFSCVLAGCKATQNTHTCDLCESDLYHLYRHDGIQISHRHHLPKSNQHINAETKWQPFSRRRFQFSTRFCLEKNSRIPILISLELISKGPMNNDPVLVQIKV